MHKFIRCSFPAVGFALALLWLFQTPLHAAIYKWKDDRGKIHFTDDKSKIPLKYRDQIKKFKGVVVEPTPEPVEESGDTSEETEAAAPEPEGEDEATAEEKPEKKKKNAKLIALLKATIKFLEDENRTHQRLINFVKPDVINGRYYVVPVRKGVGQKEAMIKKLKGAKLPSLKRARRFLKGSVFQDKQVKIGGDDYLERIQRLKQRLESEIRSKKKIIEQLQFDLKREDK